MRILCDQCQTEYVISNGKLDPRQGFSCPKCGHVIRQATENAANDAAVNQLSKWQSGSQTNASRSNSKSPSWYYSYNGESSGPFTESDLIAKFQSASMSEIAPMCYVWCRQFKDVWKPVMEVEPFASAVLMPPPPAETRLSNAPREQRIASINASPTRGLSDLKKDLKATNSLSTLTAAKQLKTAPSDDDDEEDQTRVGVLSPFAAFQPLLSTTEKSKSLPKLDTVPQKNNSKPAAITPIGTRSHADLKTSVLQPFGGQKKSIVFPKPFATPVDSTESKVKTQVAAFPEPLLDFKDDIGDIINDVLDDENGVKPLASNDISGVPSPSPSRSLSPLDISLHLSHNSAPKQSNSASSTPKEAPVAVHAFGAEPKTMPAVINLFGAEPKTPSAAIHPFAADKPTNGESSSIKQSTLDISIDKSSSKVQSVPDISLDDDSSEVQSVPDISLDDDSSKVQSVPDISLDDDSSEVQSVPDISLDDDSSEVQSVPDISLDDDSSEVRSVPDISLDDDSSAVQVVPDISLDDDSSAVQSVPDISLDDANATDADENHPDVLSLAALALGSSSAPASASAETATAPLPATAPSNNADVGILDSTAFNDLFADSPSTQTANVNHDDVEERRRALFEEISAATTPEDEATPDMSEASQLINLTHFTELKKENDRKSIKKAAKYVAGAILILALISLVAIYVSNRNNDSAPVVTAASQKDLFNIEGRVITEEEFARMIPEDDFEIIEIPAPRQKTRRQRPEQVNGNEAAMDALYGNAQPDAAQNAGATEPLPDDTPVKRTDGRATVVLRNNGDSFGNTDAVKGSKYQNAAAPSDRDRFTIGLRSVSKTIQECYRREAKTGSMTPEKLYVSFSLQPTGTIDTFSIEQEVPETFIRCLNAKKDRWKFPPFDAEKNIQFRQGFILD